MPEESDDAFRLVEVDPGKPSMLVPPGAHNQPKWREPLPNEERWVAIIMPVDVYRSYKGALDRAIAALYELGAQGKTIPPVLTDPTADASRLDEISEYAELRPFYAPSDPQRWREPDGFRLETWSVAKGWEVLIRAPFKRDPEKDLGDIIEAFLRTVEFRPFTGAQYRVFAESQGREELLLEWRAQTGATDV